MTTISVLLPLPLNKAYDYLQMGEEPLSPGSFVEVPFGNLTILGLVWDRTDDRLAGDDAPDAIDTKRLKAISGVLDILPMREELRRFIQWVADYTLAPVGNVLRMCLRSLPIGQIESVRNGFTIAPAIVDQIAAGTLNLSPARQRVLAVLQASPPLPASVLATEAACSAGVVKAMADAGLLIAYRIGMAGPRALPDPDHHQPALSPAQADAADQLREAVIASDFSVWLLDGVTGSGKTETYFEAISSALKIGRQALVLLPEIALSSGWQERFEHRFGCVPAIWHSDVASRDRKRVWRDVADGRARVVVGARSALFLPFQNLGTIIVDEEHDSSFKQEDGVVYQARDMAVVRARLCRATIILASATPSLETLVNVERGRYNRLSLPERHKGAALPTIHLVDLRKDKPERQRYLAPTLVKALTETLERHEQSMLFLNRRGYAPLTLCRSCGYRVECPNCTAWLVEHRLIGKLICHHCGLMAKPPEICPACGDKNSFVPCGPGVERLAEEVAARFPSARMEVMASDTLERPNSAAELLRRVADHEIDILIGTQIVAKGHHFPLLTLVGVVDADLGLSGGDLRGAERTYHLLHQVAGRAGRAEKPGRVLLQTHDPEHPVMHALLTGERDKFLAAEADARRSLHMPPFGRLAALIVSGVSPEMADEAARAISRAAPHLKGVDILGPALAPLAILKGRHRRRFLVKAERNVKIQAVVQGWLAGLRFHSAVKIQIDIDPYSFL